MTKPGTSFYQSVGISLLMMLISVHQAVASNYQQYYIGNNKIKANISSKYNNRIEVEGWGLAQVIGDEEQYQLVHDDRGVNIFIKPLSVKDKEKIEMALVSNSGQVADLILTPRENIEGQVIKIKHHLPSSIEKSRQDKDEVKQMMTAMLRGEEGKYYIQTFGSGKLLPIEETGLDIPFIKVRQLVNYHYQGMNGTKLELINTSKQGIRIKADSFNRLFKGIVLVHLNQEVIKPLSKMQVYIISKEEGDKG